MPRYKPGESGNPKGRPPGCGKVHKYRRLLEDHADALIQTVIDHALAGEPTALKMCLDRLIPPYRPESLPVTIDLPEKGLVQAGQVVLNAISDGSLSPDQGTAILQALVAQTRLIEVQDLIKRIEALEANRGQQAASNSVDAVIRPA